MASDSNTHHKSSRNQQQKLVSTMIKQGFISDPFLSPSRLNSLSPPPTFRPVPSPTLSPNPNQSPTLFEMMSLEQVRESKPPPDAHKKLQERIAAILSQSPFHNVNSDNNWGVGDVRLTIAARDEESDGGGETLAFRVSMDLHRTVLAAKSRFFAEKLRRSGTHSVEILECDDVEVYVHAVVLIYCEDLKAKLMGMEVSKILALLQVFSAFLFDDGIIACLEYLEAVPWSEKEEERVVSHLNQLQLDGSRTDDVLQRVIAEPSTSSRVDDIFLKLSTGMLQAKNDKARREMKILISQLLREETVDKLEISRETLYHLCHRCLSSLVLCLSEATCIDESTQDRGILMGEIAREADNIQWVVDILIDRKIGDEFVKLWAEQKELAILHSKIPTMYRHEISKITAQLCIAIGRGHILVPKDTRFSLLSTWLEALYEDFGWMRRASRAVDKKLVEEGLSQTILTLPLPQQQSILLNWFHRFLNRGDDCPNIQRAFEIWWRRAFVKQYLIGSQLQITICDYPN
ncbi:BTB/POZ domain-containing protein [Forsythia ovata]|uniref:BTB/POZ domain-containing protein n=1 Tax=Forsythia ovata TaxID=205694 RepID=A0ABD1RHA3_9LAMI